MAMKTFKEYVEEKCIIQKGRMIVDIRQDIVLASVDYIDEIVVPEMLSKIEDSNGPETG